MLCFSLQQKFLNFLEYSQEFVKKFRDLEERLQQTDTEPPMGSFSSLTITLSSYQIISLTLRLDESGNGT